MNRLAGLCGDRVPSEHALVRKVLQRAEHGEDDHYADHAHLDCRCTAPIGGKPGKERPDSLQSLHFTQTHFPILLGFSHFVPKKRLSGVKILENFSTFIPVVAVALLSGEGRVLLQRRKTGKMHGGLWEFPGGKVEAGESPESALIREIDEELGIALDPASLAPLTFASDPVLPPAPRAPHVILLYTCRRWTGAIECRDGEELAWFDIREISGLAMPPLDYPLARMLISSN